MSAPHHARQHSGRRFTPGTLAFRGAPVAAVPKSRKPTDQDTFGGRAVGMLSRAHAKRCAPASFVRGLVRRVDGG